MNNYVIKREDRPGQMLMELGIGSCIPLWPYEWTKYPQCATHFNEEEAQATIEFITNVIDWQLGEQLYVEEVK